MAVPKSKGTRVGWLVTTVMEHPLLHQFYAGPPFHFGSQNNVAGILILQDNEHTTLVLQVF